MKRFIRNVGLRIAISLILPLSLLLMFLSIFTFPITYWIFGISPESVMDWAVDTVEDLSERTNW